LAKVNRFSNLSEGAAKSSVKDFARFLEMAIGSVNELETTLIVAKNIQFISDETFKRYENEIIEIRKMITKFIESLKSDI
jgi:four helix bundle protein